MDTTTSHPSNDDEHAAMHTSSSACLIACTDSQTNKISTVDYEQTSDGLLTTFCTWNDREQLLFVENLLKHMHSHQHGQINALLSPMLQRDFIGQLAGRGLEHIGEKILGYLDDRSLVSTECVCRTWYHVISRGRTAVRFTRRSNEKTFRFVQECSGRNSSNGKFCPTRCGAVWSIVAVGRSISSVRFSNRVKSRRRTSSIVISTRRLSVISNRSKSIGERESIR